MITRVLFHYVHSTETIVFIYLFSLNWLRPAGTFENDQATGRGVYKFSNGDVYEGSITNGLLNGRGKNRLATATGIVYVGDFEANMKHGKGIITYPNGNSYEGEFACDKKEGKVRVFRLGCIYLMCFN